MPEVQISVGQRPDADSLSKVQGVHLPAKGAYPIHTMNLRHCPEPEIIYPEKQFERALEAVIRANLHGSVASAIVPGFGLDFAIFTHHANSSRIVFVEAKSYGGQRQGGVGFGNGLGEGPQVDILLSSTDQLTIFDRHVRWAFADATRPPGSTRYALLTCSEARDAAMGHVARGKQNNFRLSALTEHFIAWPVLCENLLAFLSTAASVQEQ